MKKRLLSAILVLCIMAWMIPGMAQAGEVKNVQNEENATIIYVSNKGTGSGESEDMPTTLTEAVSIINNAKSETEEPLEFIIYLTEDIENDIPRKDLELKGNITTIIGNGHFIKFGGYIHVQDGILNLGRADGSDCLILKDESYYQAHSVVHAKANSEVHMYDGVFILGAEDAFESESCGHGVGASSGGKFYMHGGEISGFSVVQPGGGVLINSGEFYMYGGKITNCESRGGTQFGGGAIFADGTSEIHIFGGELTNNRADNSGGAIAAYPDVLVEIKGNVEISENKAYRGGAIHIQNSSSLHIEGDVIFRGNESVNNGGAISALSGCQVTIKDGVRFKDNVSLTGYGGAIFHQRDARNKNGALFAEGTVFEGNEAAYGGAVFSLGGLGGAHDIEASFSDCMFKDNAAKIYIDEDDVQDGGFGGALYVNDVKLDLFNCIIESNTADDSAGGVYFDGQQPDFMELDIRGATKIWKNSAAKANNLYLLKVPALNPEEEYQTYITVSGTLSDNDNRAKIGVYMDKPGVFTSGYADNYSDIEPGEFFISDDLAYHVEITDDGEGTLAIGQTDYGDVVITPANITVYTGGEGYTGIVDDFGNTTSEDNGMPEPGYYITLPENLNDLLEGNDSSSDLSGIVEFAYSDDSGKSRTWNIELYGTQKSVGDMQEEKTSGYIYRILPGVDEHGQEIPVRLQLRDPNTGDVIINDKFKPGVDEQYREYSMRIYTEGLNEEKITAKITLNDGSTVFCGISYGNGILSLRGVTEKDNIDTAKIVNKEEMLTGQTISVLADEDAVYYVNSSNVELSDKSGIRLLLDDVIDDKKLIEYIEKNMTDIIPSGEYKYEQKYIDLVDINNGNAYLTTSRDDTLAVYWPMPEKFDENGDFYIVHFDALDRNYDNFDEELKQNEPDMLPCELVSVGTAKYIRFETKSLSPFVLAYESKSGGGSTGGGSGSISGYTIKSHAGLGGSISPDGYVTVYQGSNKEFRIYSEEGYVISDVLIDGESVGPVKKYVFENIRSNHTIEAVFEPLHQVVDPDKSGVSRWLNTVDHNAYLKGYETGLFCPDNYMTRAETAQMFYNLLLNKDVPITASFKDVSAGSWYAEAVNTLASIGIINGEGDNIFSPDRAVTRAEFAAISMRFSNLKSNGENVFSDVNDNDWFYSDVTGAVANGWIMGYDDGTFRPDNNITRAEVTVIVNRMLGRSADENYVSENDETLLTFKDVSKSHWAYYNIVEATNTHDYKKVENTEIWTGTDD